MKPIIIAILSSVALCGCGPREKYIDSADYKQLIIDALNRRAEWNETVLRVKLAGLENRISRLESTNPYPCWQIEGARLVPVYGTNYGTRIDQ